MKRNMRFFRNTIVLAALAVCVLDGCKSQYELLLEGNDTDAKYEAAFDFFNQGKYTKAASLFESVAFYVGGTEREDTVQYYRGLSNYRAKDYFTAETNFSEFVENFPRSPFTEDARFLRIDCLYSETLRYELDQTPSSVCLSAISEYLSEYPLTPHLEECQRMIADLSERIDKKALEAAKLYYKMEYYLSAHVALKNVLKDNADNIYREEVLYYTAMSSYKYAFMSIPEKQKERYLTFMDDYLNFVGEYPESSYRKELDPLYEKSQKAIGK